MKQINFLKPKIPQLKEIINEMNNIFDNAWLTNNGKFLRNFEEKTSNYLNIDCLAVSNGTIGLILAEKALKLKGKVIVPSLTFPATAHSLVWNNLKPIFVDIDKETYNIDPEEVEKALKKNDNISAILAVNLFGNPCNISSLEELSEKYKVRLIFDSAHAFGAHYNNRKIGHFGNIEIFSTHATKIFMTGEGGIISSKNKNLISEIKKLRNFGYSEKNEHYNTQICGMNAKMQEFSAILGLWSLKHIDENIKNRELLAKRYIRNLTKIKGLSFQKTTPNTKRIYQFFSILINKEFGLNRDTLANKLKFQGIETKKYFYPPLHKHTSYKQHNNEILTNTEFVSSNILCLPLYSDLSFEEVDIVCDSIKKIYNE